MFDGQDGAVTRAQTIAAGLTVVVSAALRHGGWTGAPTSCGTTCRIPRQAEGSPGT